MFNIFCILIILFQIEKIFSIIEYNFPNYPLNSKNIGYEYHPHININKTSLMMITIKIYSDQTCIVPVGIENQCFEVGKCELIEKEKEQGKSFQIWSYSLDRVGNYPFVLIDFFYYINGEGEGKSICNYDVNDTRLYNGTNVLYGGSIEDERDVESFGGCGKSNNLYPEYYLRYYVGDGCKDNAGGEFKTFVRKQKTPLLIGAFVAIPTIVLPLLFVIFFCLYQCVAAFVLDTFCLLPTRVIAKSIAESDEKMIGEEELKKQKDKSDKDVELGLEEKEEEETDESKKEKKKIFSSERFPVMSMFIGSTVYSASSKLPEKILDYRREMKNKDPKTKTQIFFSGLFGSIKSILMIILLEVMGAFSLWFSIICFLLPVDDNDANYPEKIIIYNNYFYILILVLIIYFVCEVTLLVWWIAGNVVSPIKVMIIYGVYKYVVFVLDLSIIIREWLVYRLLSCSVFLVYSFFGACAFLASYSDYVDTYNQKFQALFTNVTFLQLLSREFLTGFINLLIFWAKFITSELLLLLNVYTALSYRSCSNISFYRRLKEMKIRFPVLNLGGSLFSNPDSVINEIKFLLSLIKTVDYRKIYEIDESDQKKLKRDIKHLQSSIDYGDLRWKYINKLTATELKFLKEAVFMLTTNYKDVLTRMDQQFIDTVFYASPIRPEWWKVLLGFSAAKCVQTCKRTMKKFSKAGRSDLEIELENRYNVLKQKYNDILLRAEDLKFEMMREQNDGFEKFILKYKPIIEERERLALEESERVETERIKKKEDLKLFEEQEAAKRLELIASKKENLSLVDEEFPLLTKTEGKGDSQDEIIETKLIETEKENIASINIKETSNEEEIRSTDVKESSDVVVEDIKESSNVVVEEAEVKIGSTEKESSDVAVEDIKESSGVDHVEESSVDVVDED